jgi:LAGLIDADG DNA endonuclease family
LITTFYGGFIKKKIIYVSFNYNNSLRVLHNKAQIDNNILFSIPKETLEIITGNLLGDGSLRRPKPNTRIGLESEAKASFSMTLSVKGYNYMVYLYDKVYAQFSSSGIHAYPNISLPQHKDKIVTQYSFTTMRTPLFTALHDLWYRWDKNTNTYVKVVPMSISDWFSPRSLAHWIMEDGYFDSYGRTQTIILCTESFTKAECIFLQTILWKFNIKSTLKIRNKIKDTYRIRISKTNMPLLRKLVIPYMHKDYMYKLQGQ